jgi:hypothetical protein
MDTREAGTARSAGLAATPAGGIAVPEAPSGAERARAWAAGLAAPRGALPILGAVALVPRVALAVGMVFPPLGDAAYYIAVARTLAAGGGLTAGVVWTYQPPPATVVGPSNEYWGPLTSVVEALSLRVFGDHLLAALLPGLVAGTLLVLVTYLAGRGVLRSWLVGRGEESAVAKRHADWLALAAALLLAVDAELVYQSVMGDSGMIYGLLACGAVVLWERATRPAGRLAARATAERPAWWARARGWPGASIGAWGAGVLLGGAYLTRASALFLALALGGWWLWRLWRAWGVRARSTATPAGAGARGASVELIGAAGALAIGTLVVMVPWLVRQQVTFGHVVSREGTLSALAFSLEEISNYGAAPTLAGYLQHGLGALLALRAAALWDELRHVADFAFYPTVLPALAGLTALARRETLARLGLVSALVLGLGFAVVFPVVSLNGGFYHSVASVAPFLAWGYLAGIYAVAIWARRRLPLRVGLAPALLAIPLLLQLAVLALTFPAVGAQAAHDRSVFGAVSGWLRAHQARVVMADQSSTLYFASGIPTIQLPGAQGPGVVYACAERYGAEYLVVTGPYGQYPAVLDAHPSPHFVLVARGGDYRIYAIER